MSEEKKTRETADGVLQENRIGAESRGRMKVRALWERKIRDKRSMKKVY